MAYDCYQKQEYSMALKYAQKCIKKAPENVPAILLLANIYYALQNYSQACDLYHQVLDINSNYLGYIYNSKKICSGSRCYQKNRADSIC